MDDDDSEVFPSRATDNSAVKKSGRPSKLNPELQARLTRLISIGVPVRTACEAEGVTKTTLRNWRAKAAEGIPEYQSFVLDLDQALAKAEVGVTMHVVKAAQHDWRAGAWWLERRRPEHYGAKQTVVLEKAPTEMTDEELDAALAKHGYSRGEDGKDPDDGSEGG
jgi:transposase-like protein